MGATALPARRDHDVIAVTLILLLVFYLRSLVPAGFAVEPIAVIAHRSISLIGLLGVAATLVLAGLLNRATRTGAALCGACVMAATMAFWLGEGQAVPAVTMAVRTVVFGIAFAVWRAPSRLSAGDGLALILVAAFGLAAVMHFLRVEALDTEYARWGLPGWTRVALGSIETVLALLFILPRARPVAAWGAVVILAGALGLFIADGAAGVVSDRVFSVLYYLTPALALIERDLRQRRVRSRRVAGSDTGKA